MSKALDRLNKELDKLVKDPSNVKDYSRFEKDKTQKIGIISSVLRKFSSEQFKQVKSLDKKEILLLCEKLLKSKKIGKKAIAFDWAFRIREQYTKPDFIIFESWIKKYVNSWGSCDDFCTHALGDFLYQFPEFVKKTKNWARSKNIWLRRASAVALIYSARKKKRLNDIFKIAEILLQDKEDLVQKGYGWTLKESSNVFTKEVYEFVLKNKKAMPRTALRYAIEKLPKKWKQEVMKKD